MLSVTGLREYSRGQIRTEMTELYRCLGENFGLCRFLATFSVAPITLHRYHGSQYILQNARPGSSYRIRIPVCAFGI